MLLFLNIDCVLAPPADAVGPHADGAAGVRRFEAVLHAWPQLRVVVTSDRRYRMTLEHFRGFFAVEFRHRLIATTPLYSARTQVSRRTREDEVLDWLRHAASEHADWLALDSRADDYAAHADRLLLCTTLTRSVVAELNAELLRRAGEHEAVVHVPSDAPWRSGGVDCRLVAPPLRGRLGDQAAEAEPVHGDAGERARAPWLVPRTSIRDSASSRSFHVSAAPIVESHSRSQSSRRWPFL
jgi:hypothetical protein